MHFANIETVQSTFQYTLYTTEQPKLVLCMSVGVLCICSVDMDLSAKKYISGISYHGKYIKNLDEHYFQ